MMRFISFDSCDMMILATAAAAALLLLLVMISEQPRSEHRALDCQCCCRGRRELRSRRGGGGARRDGDFGQQRQERKGTPQSIGSRAGGRRAPEGKQGRAEAIWPGLLEQEGSGSVRTSKLIMKQYVGLRSQNPIHH